MTASPLHLLGAHHDRGVTRFCVWAPQARQVTLVIEDTREELALERAKDGYFIAETRSAPIGTRYRYRVNGEGPWPDPCSRCQPEGVHGPSQVVDRPFDW